MDNQDNQNIKVKRTKEDIKLYNRLYCAYVRKNINIMQKNITQIIKTFINININ